MQFKDLQAGAWFSFDRRGINGAVGLISGPFQKLSPSTYRYYHRGQWYTTVVGLRAALVELVSAEELEAWARA